jgi:hypothetical protein
MVRNNNSSWELQREVEGDGTTVVQGTGTPAAWTRSWGNMTSYLAIRLINTVSTQTVSAGTQWFDATSFSIELADNSNPALSILSGHDSWVGTGGACIRYGFTDAGSGINATSLTNLTTGTVYDNPSYASSNITTGVFSNDRNCVGVAVPAGGTGTYTLRAAAADKSGNGANSDFSVSFDVTAPSVGIPQFAASDVTDGQDFLGSYGQYRPTFSNTYSDAHSGGATAQILYDGNVVGSGTTWTPASDLALGSHTIAWRVTDQVGNQTTVSRQFDVIDDVVPTFTVALPAATGDNTPLLDITGADDKSGFAPATYTVTVNGVTLAASTATNRLQAPIGTLVNGQHTIVVTARDAAGNTGQQTINYTASSGVGDPSVPADQLTGIYVFASPSGSISEGAATRVAAIMSTAGRPVVGRAEIRKDSATMAGKDLSVTGLVDMQVTIDREGPIKLHGPAGSGLTPVDVTYTYVPKPPDPGGKCKDNPSLSECQTGDGSDETTIVYCGTVGAPVNCATPILGTCQGPWSCNQVVLCAGTTSLKCYNGLPVGESGGPEDKVAPTYKMTVVPMKRSWVASNAQLRVKLWTNELSVVKTQVAGSKVRTTASARRTWRVIALVMDKKDSTYKTLMAAKRGESVSVRVRVQAQDKNKNQTVFKWHTLKFKM